MVTGDDDPDDDLANPDKGWRMQEKLCQGSKNDLKLSPAMHACPALDLYDSTPIFVCCDQERAEGKKATQNMF